MKTIQRAYKEGSIAVKNLGLKIPSGYGMNHQCVAFLGHPVHDKSMIE